MGSLGSPRASESVESRGSSSPVGPSPSSDHVDPTVKDDDTKEANSIPASKTTEMSESPADNSSSFERGGDDDGEAIEMKETKKGETETGQDHSAVLPKKPEDGNGQDDNSVFLDEMNAKLGE